MSTTGLDLVNNKSKQTICREKPKVVKYGLIECFTKMDDMGSSAFDVKLKHNDKFIDCSAKDSKVCQYTQTDYK